MESLPPEKETMCFFIRVRKGLGYTDQGTGDGRSPRKQKADVYNPAGGEKSNRYNKLNNIEHGPGTHAVILKCVRIPVLFQCRYRYGLPEGD